MSRNRRLEQVRTELETLKLTRSEKRRPVKSTPREGFGERLATALPAMSPLFALFGRYLAGRTDRLPLRDCRDLDGILISVEPTSMSRVGLLLSSQLGGPLTDHFGAFEEARQTDLLYQWHDAELLDGTAVTVKLIRPEAWGMVDSELELLPALEQLDLESGDAALLVEDFVVWLDRQLDLGRELIGLDQLAAEVGTFDAFEIPTRLPELCSCQVVTTHRTDGETLGDLIDRPGTHRPALARHLCQVWLQQALLEGSCPEGPLAENLRVLSTERFAITGGLVTTLDSRWRRHLIDAIIATAKHDPDRACDAMLAECTKLDHAAEPPRVRSELRQAETFRSGGWTKEYSGRHIADGFFVYWRKLTDLGYRPKDHAVAFLRGFSEIEAVARSLAPNTDVVAGAIDDFRLVAAAVSVREHLGPGVLIHAAEELAPVIGEILEHPGRLADRFLNPTVDQASVTTPKPQRTASWQIFIGSMAVLTAGTILGVTAIRAHPGQTWIEWAVALGFIGASAGIFRLVGGNSGR